MRLRLAPESGWLLGLPILRGVGLHGQRMDGIRSHRLLKGAVYQLMALYQALAFKLRRHHHNLIVVVAPRSTWSGLTIESPE
jgi:hypothetical protein